MTSNAQTENKRGAINQETIARQKIEKKLRIVNELFQIAYETKRYQLRKKHPELDDREINHRAYALIERGCR